MVTVAVKAVGDRWRSAVVGAVTVGLFLLGGMAAYRSIDLSIYTGLPEAARSLIGIPAEADVASLSFGAIYRFYGALTLAAIALSIGAASIAGEERDGTMGLLLGTPRSRRSVLLAKAVALTALTAVGAVILWAAGVAAPRALGVDITGIHVGALVLHVFAVSLFFGCLALAIGAWTGRPGTAIGGSVAVLVVSFVAVGLLPLFAGVADLARLFPWYYLDAGEPVLNGVQAGPLAVLLVGSLVLTAAAVVGFERRDLRSGNGATSLVDRLRDDPRTRRLVERLAGSTRVSRIWIKTASEHQAVTLISASSMFAFMGVMLAPMYAAIRDTLASLSTSLPDALLALVGHGDMSTPEGWYQVETFSMMAPAAVMVVTVTVGAKALAGEEAQRTMGLLLANPVRRSSVVLAKTVAMVAQATVVGVATFAGVTTGSLVSGLGMDAGGIAAASLLATLLGLVFGALALALGAATGRVRIAVTGSVGAALAAYLLSSFLPLSDRLAGLARWSPFHYYLGGDPLNAGLDVGDALVLLGLFVVLVAAAVPLFQRRDLRSG